MPPSFLFISWLTETNKTAEITHSWKLHRNTKFCLTEVSLDIHKLAMDQNDGQRIPEKSLLQDKYDRDLGSYGKTARISKTIIYLWSGPSAQ
jgi:hypothetical protein